MHDMLVRLCSLPPADPQQIQHLVDQGIRIRRCRPYELHNLQHWVGSCFSPKWVSEATVAMGHRPPGCYIATQDKQIVGFVCYDATARGFVGPMGVQESVRGKGVGRLLLLKALDEMRALGYVYAIIGGVGPAEFYAKTVGATDIENSAPGIYEDILPDVSP